MYERVKIDMSPKAVFLPLREVGDLYELGKFLMKLKPVGPVNPEYVAAHPTPDSDKRQKAA